MEEIHQRPTHAKLKPPLEICDSSDLNLRTFMRQSTNLINFYFTYFEFKIINSECDCVLLFQKSCEMQI